jgi:hypothetical protein
VACPFFMPTIKLDDGGWQHPSRLPLGAGWNGRCSAPGYEDAEPTDQELHELCNLGYAVTCPRLPRERTCDAVRFSIARDQGNRLHFHVVCESGHAPASHSMLEYDVVGSEWISAHPDVRIQKMAECYLQSCLLRRIQPASTGHMSKASPSPTPCPTL